MTIMILILSLLLLTGVSSQTASFTVDGNKATLVADWVQHNKEIEAYVAKYN